MISRCAEETLCLSIRLSVCLGSGGSSTSSTSVKSSIYPKTSHMYPQKSHTYPQKSHIYPQKSHMYPQKSHMYPQKSHVYPQKTPSYPLRELLDSLDTYQVLEKFECRILDMCESCQVLDKFLKCECQILDNWMSRTWQDSLDSPGGLHTFDIPGGSWMSRTWQDSSRRVEESTRSWLRWVGFLKL